MNHPHLSILCLCSTLFFVSANAEVLPINESDYFESPTLNIMVFDDYYPEGHQGGISLIQHGMRLATNGDVRMSRDPGQWQPIPRKDDRTVDRTRNLIKTDLTFPDDSRTMKGFNPMPDPGVQFKYSVEVKGIEDGIDVKVILQTPLPPEMQGKLHFNLEIFPTRVFGKTFLMDDITGIFPRQPDSVVFDESRKLQILPLASGHHLTIAPDDELCSFTIISQDAPMALLDGRGVHNNGWFVVSSPINVDSENEALHWVIKGYPKPDWKPLSTILVSQIGYHSNQEKVAYLECPKSVKPTIEDVSLEKFLPETGWKSVLSKQAENWGPFLRFEYGIFDFSAIKESGLYRVRYAGQVSHAFQISDQLLSRHVWQPTIEYFLPVQMCHMRVNEKYRVWHDRCHEDDALMAPVDINHFDGYSQGPETLTTYSPLQHVPGLDRGGWHDAGDYDLRVESQAGTVYMLAQAFEIFHPDIDETTIDQASQTVEIHAPDGKNDFLQQIEHGLLTIVGGYDALGRLYRGIIAPTLRQYVLLGDASAMTDGKIYEDSGKANAINGVWYQKVANAQSVGIDPQEQESRVEVVEPALDDRLVFTEENPYRSLEVAAALACASRVMVDYDASLSQRCREIAEALWHTYSGSSDERLWASKTKAAVELLKTTQNAEYRKYILDHQGEIIATFARSAASVATAVNLLEDESFSGAATLAAKAFVQQVDEMQKQTPFGVPYRPAIWGDGWKIQAFGVQQYFLHQTWPELYPAENLLKAINFVMGCHPGPNPASFVSGVGAQSVLTAYGVNRADWSYIPGGSVSGTALIRPDFPELLEWPYFWQQTEYVMGGGATHFVFMVLAASDMLNHPSSSR